ncbi:hypothetical protein BAE46_13410 [Glaciecola punicea]|jgi:hypothetical protein|uniref:hypothetical protein n=1 Tax=Glaciecola punicea TaxID=56804 RepID=UPI00087323A4|nr:hypothetical protein [Glaciecola punicea]OFA29878.1 hypothetical protein BAE46_13410 [Glaciecola punicea]
MTDINKLDLAGTKAKGQRPYFLENKQTEQVMSIAMALSMELTVTRERVGTLECLLEEKGVLTRTEINSYQPNKQEVAKRSSDTQVFLARILRVLQQDREEMQGNDPTMEEVQEWLTRET